MRGARRNAIFGIFRQLIKSFSLCLYVSLFVSSFLSFALSLSLSHSLIQVVFLTSLCSSHPDIVARGMEGLGLLCEESELFLEYVDVTTDPALFEYLDVRKGK